MHWRRARAPCPKATPATRPRGSWQRELLESWPDVLCDIPNRKNALDDAGDDACRVALARWLGQLAAHG